MSVDPLELTGTEAQPSLNTKPLFKLMVDRKASDLFFTSNAPIKIKIEGQIYPINKQVLPPAAVRTICYGLMTPEQIVYFQRELEIDFAISEPGLGRFRVNIFLQRGYPAMVLRYITADMPRLDGLGLPETLTELAMAKRGLVLVVGSTGSGKSTTLAAMINHRNEAASDHVVTIEDPIEFLHTHKRCIVNQRELHADTHSFPNALRAVLREDPDIVLVGEMRDLETMEMALRVAETGHLTLATLHTNSAVQTMNRIIDSFPANQQSQVRAQLSFVLEGILCQSLLPRTSGKGRCMAMEILIPTPAIRNLIREDKLHQVYSMMQTGQNKYGMQTFNQSLATLVHRRVISQELAMSVSSLPDELAEMIARGAGVVTTTAAGGTAVPGAPANVTRRG